MQLADKVCAIQEGVLKENAVRQERYEKLAKKREEAVLLKLIKNEIREEKREEKGKAALRHWRGRNLSI